LLSGGYMSINIGTVSFDLEDIENSIKYVAEGIQYIKEKNYKKEIQNVLKARSFEIENNNKLTKLIYDFYLQNTSDMYKWEVDLSIIMKREWVLENPIDISHMDDNKCNLNISLVPIFDKISYNIYKDSDIIPKKAKEYTSILTNYTNTYLRNDKIYRIKGVSINEDKIEMTFCLDTYFNYINTCRLISLETSKAIIKKGLENHDVENNEVFNSLHIRNNIDIFDFNNRIIPVGINTLFILADPKKEDLMILHKRNKIIFDGPCTINVIPAGTFQPLCEGFVNTDFSFINNIVKEFCEKILGVEKLILMTNEKTCIDEIPIARKIKMLIKKNLAKIYLLSFGFDPLTTKFEIATTMIIDKEAFDSFIDNKIINKNNEGEIETSDYSLNSLKYYLSKDDFLTPGKNCLKLTELNYNYFEEEKKRILNIM